ncbi:MAG TPA: thiamine pyrophosphate-dependent dehydrogenase E1 component subunit alpha [Burkholderiaceae bacterium]|nr:thiamine pyrophosphate-dependent dehydrogenase E1 component subunit alpha [Burkholderiaceae bacterium]
MNPSDKPQALADLAAMYRIRLLEEKITELRKQQIIQGSVHLCVGQEALYVGARGALTSEDRVFCTYRGHGWAMACGVPAEGILAELLGRETGVCQGRGGSAMFSAADHGFYGENSIVGAGAPIACGAALSARVKQEPRVVLTAFGDGAMNQGGIHEAMNFAAYLDLPVLFVCENNTYAELTPIADTVRDPELYKRAAAYGMPGERIDGNALAAVRACVARHASRAREGHGPALIEMMTQRLVGHYYGDMQGYRPKGELTEAKRHEPIARLRAGLGAQGVSVAELDAVEVGARGHTGGGAGAARAAPLAPAASVKRHLYA